MDNKIQTSLDWHHVSADVRYRIRNLKFENRRDLALMIEYVDHLVDELSKEEINCRRLQKQTRKHQELTEKINTRLEEIDQLITFAALLN